MDSTDASRQLLDCHHPEDHPRHCHAQTRQQAQQSRLHTPRLHTPRLHTPRLRTPPLRNPPLLARPLNLREQHLLLLLGE